MVMNEDLTRLTLVCGGWVADVKQLSAAEFLGKVTSHTGKIITDGQIAHVHIKCRLSICSSSFSDHLKDLGKLESFESLECFFLLYSYSFERLR